MAGKISELSAAAALTGAEQFELLQGGGNVREDLDAIKAFALASLTSGSSILKGDGSGGVANAASGTDYAPPTSGTSILYGNGSGGFSSVTIGSGLSFSTGTLSATGGGSLPAEGSEGDVLTVVSGSWASAPLTTISVDDLTDTWTDGGANYGIRINVTDTSSSSASRLLLLRRGGTDRMYVDKDGKTVCGDIETGTAGYGYFGFNGMKVKNNSFIGFASASSSVNASSASPDTAFYRTAAGIMAVRGSNTSTGAAIEFIEQTAPSAGASNTVRIYAEDNGSGKTRLMALFPTGAAQQIAIEP